jgi:hypothetical protein
VIRFEGTSDVQLATDLKSDASTAQRVREDVTVTADAIVLDWQTAHKPKASVGAGLLARSICFVGLLLGFILLAVFGLSSEDDPASLAELSMPPVLVRETAGQQAVTNGEAPAQPEVAASLTIVAPPRRLGVDLVDAQTNPEPVEPSPAKKVHAAPQLATADVAALPKEAAAGDKEVSRQAPRRNQSAVDQARNNRQWTATFFDGR